MIYMWFTGINYQKLVVEKDRDSIFMTIWKRGLTIIPYSRSFKHTTVIVG
jgi:hypothetical protein